METFYFLIPLAVISAMGLTHDGQTVSKWVRVSDLLAGGLLTANDYHLLASAGVVVTQQYLFTFESVEETAQGWICAHLEPEPQAWVHTLSFLRELFLNKPTPTGEGLFRNRMECSYELLDRLPIDWQEMTLLTVEGPLSIQVNDIPDGSVESVIAIEAITESSDPLRDLIDYNG